MRGSASWRGRRVREARAGGGRGEICARRGENDERAARSRARTTARTHQRALHVERVLLDQVLGVCDGGGRGCERRVRRRVRRGTRRAARPAEAGRSRGARKDALGSRQMGDARRFARAEDAPASHLSCSSCADNGAMRAADIVPRSVREPRARAWPPRSTLPPRASSRCPPKEQRGNARGPPTREFQKTDERVDDEQPGDVEMDVARDPRSSSRGVSYVPLSRLPFALFRSRASRLHPRFASPPLSLGRSLTSTARAPP